MRVPANARRPPSSPESFYRQALSRAERLRLPEARSLEGLDEEIALLRVRLATLAKEHPENLELLMKGINLLVRAVAARYKLSPRSQEDLAQNLAGLLQGIGTALLPEESNGV